MEAFNYGVNGNASTQSTAHYGLPTPPYNGTSSRTDLPVAADREDHPGQVVGPRGGRTEKV